MYHEVWRVEQSLLLRSNFHGVNTVRGGGLFICQSLPRALGTISSRELSGFSVGHLKGTGGTIPEAKRVPGGLLKPTTKRQWYYS
jgi:tricorn protease